jgi:hypothetical protein
MIGKEFFLFITNMHIRKKLYPRHSGKTALITLYILEKDWLVDHEFFTPGLHICNKLVYEWIS